MTGVNYGIPISSKVMIMGNKVTRLTDKEIKGVKPSSKDKVLSDGDGLQLRVRSAGTKSWNFNYLHPFTRKRINMGLGTYPSVSLALARKKAIEARSILAHQENEDLAS